ncbi:phytanoyl-CoA dioxygenase family protein [Streptomyces sp. SID14478]|uniref:phytanoyl-CoA dioxygenase family protein n=1 Tax=Streptomyces sp. SID14478 TaxID=2706073 RepID=UPI0013DCB5D8|nr:phytanoyl-CoA dioxygenase family protein [Streptomyces sp. SID14478]NEB74521.1 phytanoyl-CoA dioxygenase family protein [Streptomyces sp. SID14478]
MSADTPAQLYRSDRLAPLLDSPQDIGPAELDAYRGLGFLAVRRALDAAEVREVLDALAAVARPPSPAAVELEAWVRPDEASPDELLDGVRKLMSFTDHDPRLARLARHPAVTGPAGRLLGGAEPVLLQDMALLKPPGGGREKPWHQDKAYFDVPLGTPVVGVWIALDDATADNGCMHVLPGTHAEGPVVHFKRRDFQICDTAVQTHRDTAVPLPAGGALYFDGLLHHGTPPNLSRTRRRAVQLHYVPAGTPHLPQERRLAVFGADGKDVSC